MTASEFFGALESRGGRLKLDGEALRYVGPGSLLTPKLREFITRHREALLLELTFRLCPGCPGARRWRWRKTGQTVCAACDPPLDLPPEEVEWLT